MSWHFVLKQVEILLTGWDPERNLVPVASFNPRKGVAHHEYIPVRVSTGFFFKGDDKLSSLLRWFVSFQKLLYENKKERTTAALRFF